MRDRIVAAIEKLFAAREAQLDALLGNLEKLEESIKARLPNDGGVIVNVNVSRTVSLGRADIDAIADAVSTPVADALLELSADRATFLHYLCQLDQIDLDGLRELSASQDAALERLIDHVRATLTDLGYDAEKRRALADAGPPNPRTPS